MPSTSESALNGVSRRVEATSARSNGCHGARKFTWKDLSKLNKPHNAHIAYRGKVCSLC